MSERRQRKEKAEGRISRGLLVLIRVLILGAIGISGYLAWTSLSGNGVAGCGPESSCDKVLHSRWAYWFGVPVSLPALFVYAAVFGLTFRLGQKSSVAQQRKVWPLLVGASALVIGAAIWFSALQLWAIKSFCPFCMTGHALGVATALLLLLNAPIGPPPEKQWQVEKFVFVLPKLARKSALVGTGAVALLAAGQVVHQGKSFSVESVPAAVMQSAAVSNASPAAYTLTASTTGGTGQSARISSAATVQRESHPTNIPAAPVVTSAPAATVKYVPVANAAGGNVIDHQFDVYLGMFKFDLRHVPLIGSPNASHAMLSLFDYTCHHCRLMHPLLVEAQQKFKDKLAIVNLPMPLDKACNYSIRRTAGFHTNACALARLGLTVWRANKDKQQQFDDFIFAGENPPLVGDATAFARQLVGPFAFDNAIEDPWINEAMQRSISIYATNYVHVHNGSMPQLMIHTNLTTGTLNGPDDLYLILDKQLGLRQ